MQRNVRGTKKSLTFRLWKSQEERNTVIVKEKEALVLTVINKGLQFRGEAAGQDNLALIYDNRGMGAVCEK